jgi:hypothetical protein
MPVTRRTNRRGAFTPPVVGGPILSVTLVNDRLEIRLQKLLKNTNRGNRSPHWSVRNRARKEWMAAISTAIVIGLGMPKAQALLLPGALYGAFGARPTVKRTLAITRLVKRKQHFILDTFDNLPWSTKELRDALVGLGLIADDSPQWCDTTISQDVSLDGQCWTVIAIAPVTLFGRSAAEENGARD